MLLKRQEKENVIKAIYKSSNILASTYNKETNDLTLIFNKGTQYKYAGVNLTDYTRLEIAESQGKVFNSHIKPHSYVKLADVDTAVLPQIITEIETLFAEEQKIIAKSKSDKLIKSMKRLIDTTGDNVLDTKQVEALGQEIIAYLTPTA